MCLAQRPKCSDARETHTRSLGLESSTQPLSSNPCPVEPRFIFFFFQTTVDPNQVASDEAN